MNKNLSLLIGSLFILTSGIIYSIERLVSYVYFVGQTNMGLNHGPQNSFFDNPFTWLFLVIGIVVITNTFVKGKR